ncbi:MAG TPA: hypothetical protein VHT03_08055 [Rhizomicrobium sp.]|jgi:hypothetical protein|nr:hypothetical protein [Rhizomicrobium sp.]
MSRRSRKRRTRGRATRQLAPKAGPGDVYVQEFLSARTGRELRYRNIGEHPLTLAHARGKISSDQFAAGEEVRRLYELRALSGRDSTQMTPGSGGAHSCAPVTESQLDAARCLERLRLCLKNRDWIIVEKFCGEGWSMAEAVRAATLCHPSGVLFRVQEALDELVAACATRIVKFA